MPADAPRAQLIHIETDRRLGHEWDEWDGKPLPGSGDFSAPPGLFFRLAALTLAVGLGAIAALIFLLAPRLAAVLPGLPARAPCGSCCCSFPFMEGCCCYRRGCSSAGRTCTS